MKKININNWFSLKCVEITNNKYVFNDEDMFNLNNWVFENIL